METPQLFKKIPGYPNYEISHNGVVRRLWRSAQPTEMIPAVKNGIYVVRLMCPDGKRKEERVHKLMQWTFLATPKPGQVLYHKNGDRLDNWINNLGYITRQELGKRTGDWRRQSVLKLSPNHEVIEIYRSAREAARQNFMSYQTFMDRCNGKVKKKIAPDGFIYRWEDARYSKRGIPIKKPIMNGVDIFERDSTS